MLRAASGCRPDDRIVAAAGIAPARHVSLRFRHLPAAGTGMTALARLLLALLVVFAAGEARAERRIALVIGNAAYMHVPALPNPANDAGDIAASLSRLGFAVQKLIDAKFDDIRQAVKKFGGEADSAEIAIIYFAGHGMEIRGENWLIPVDAELRSDSDAEAEAVNLNTFTLQVGRASRLGLVILDACRNNPFVKMKRANAGRGLDRGLVRVEPPNNILIAFAARDGTTANDGDGRNSPFTQALLDNVEKPGLEVSRLFRRVRDDVMARTRREQQPFVYGSLSRDPIYLKPAVGKAAPDLASTAGSAAAECDRLAAHPKDTKRPAGVSGVYVWQIDVAPAKAACDAAMAQQPKNPRYVYQAGRVAYAAKDFALARKYYTRAVSEGYWDAAINLGQLYENAEGVGRDYAAAKGWYEKAAAAGVAAGINAVGTLHDKGLGVAKNFDEARKLYLKAAAAGDSDACNNLGFMYANGNGVARDDGEARKWFEKAAALGHAGAMNSLGVLYLLGNGVDKNYVTAREWFDRAAALGDRDALKNIGGLYFSGQGVVQDYAEARKWYEKAAERGSADAMTDLGLIYDQGYGVTKDPAEARRWYVKAAAAGNKDARARLERAGR